MGDLNTKVGSDNINHDRTMGKEGCGKINKNEETPLESEGHSSQTMKSTSSPNASPVEETRTRSTT